MTWIGSTRRRASTPSCPVSSSSSGELYASSSALLCAPLDRLDGADVPLLDGTDAPHRLDGAATQKLVHQRGVAARRSQVQ